MLDDATIVRHCQMLDTFYRLQFVAGFVNSQEVIVSETDLSIPSGFQFAGVACGIKDSGKSDVSLIVCDKPSVAAAVYTQNKIVAAPVVICRDRTPTSSIRCVITNSGNANACTGDRGMQDAQRMCHAIADKVGCNASEVLVMSTGVIGKHLPMQNVETGICDAYEHLSSSDKAFTNAAEAICTTDRSRKTETRCLRIQNQNITIAAMAKGAGMIAPNMATMLSAICTDVSIVPDDAQAILKRVSDLSFNRVSVDGHTSTNDTLLLLASGEDEPIRGKDLEIFESALTELAINLAKQLVADGEGATHVMQIEVSGASSDASAERIARVVAASPLVKTAITGGDPNWGRIVSAAGYAEEPIEPHFTSLSIFNTVIFSQGSPQTFDTKALSEQMRREPQVDIRLSVGRGEGKAVFWASDLTTDYVAFNSEYTT